ncbi:MAG TPA: hypothetical protein VM325_19795 [Alphaproteobacteria bacterium]|nr:hypothetical protein [Alphaproteobacteria bacterium]
MPQRHSAHRAALGSVAIVLAALVLAAPPAAAETVRPFDEARQDPSFLKFRTALLAALKRGDTAAVARAAAPNVKLGFGGNDGRAQFRRYLAGDRKMHGKQAARLAADYRGWLRWVLLHGGGFSKDRRSFVAPYPNAYEWRMPNCETKPRPASRVCALDPHARAYVIGRDIPIYAGQSSQSSVVARLSYRLVELDKHVIRRMKDGRRVRLWSRVKLEDGRRGWIRPIQYYAATGHRLRAVKQGGRWRIAYFLAGD